MLHYFETTPVLDTSAYIAGDCMSDVLTITTGSTSSTPMRLCTLVVLDKADQGQAFDILFFRSSPTVSSAKNAALSIADGEMDKCVGIVRVTSGDYVDTGSNRVATIQLNEMWLKPSTSGVLYAVLVSQGTGTYGASDLVLKMSIESEG